MTKRANKPEYKLGLRYIEENGGLTGLELAELLGIDRRNALDYVRAWRDAGLVRISAWRLHRNSRGGHPSPVYGIRKSIKANDAPKPPALTNAEKQVRHRRKMSGLVTARNRRYKKLNISHDFLLLGILK